MRAATTWLKTAGTERTRPVLVARVRPSHHVRCRGCDTRFDLFAAEWCPCDPSPRSKVCPACRSCACTRPGYRDPRLWARAPPAFEHHGFVALFVEYI